MVEAFDQQPVPAPGELPTIGDFLSLDDFNDNYRTIPDKRPYRPQPHPQLTTIDSRPTPDPETNEIIAAFMTHTASGLLCYCLIHTTQNNIVEVLGVHPPHRQTFFSDDPLYKNQRW